MSDIDIRYNKDSSTNGLIEQSKVWEHESGFWRIETISSVDANGNSRYAVPYDETTGTFGGGTLTNLVNSKTFLIKRSLDLA